MRFLKLATFSVIFILSFVAAPVVRAIEVVPPQAPKIESPVIITGYALSATKFGYIQLYNSSDEVISIDDWQLQYTKANGETVSITKLDGMMKPKNYVIIADTALVPNADFPLAILHLPSPPASLKVVTSQFLDHTVTVKAEASYGFWKRNVSSSTGNFLSTFTAVQPSELALYGGGLYEYPEFASLQFVEIFANPRNCSPLDTKGDCRDYVKLHNPSNDAVDLSQYRLRVGHQGQSSSASNTFALKGILLSGGYVAIASAADDRPVALTSSGAFVRLEDTYGIKRYDNTVIEYPDASAESKKGQAWAYDTVDGQWKWTLEPMPLNAPSVIVLPQPELPKKGTVGD